MVRTWLSALSRRFDRLPRGLLLDAAAATCVLLAGFTPGLAGFGGGPGMPAPPGGPPPPPEGQWFLLWPVLVSAAAMFVRRWFPLVALMATVFLCVATGALSVPSLGPGVGLAIAMYGFAFRLDRRTALLVGGAVTAFFLLLALVEGEWATFEPRLLLQAAAVAIAAALGDGARSRTETLAVLTERAERAEQTREAEASRRVCEERLRIARDLHDTVAHQISVISLNAGAASRALPGRPERAEQALAAIRGASRDVLAEISELLQFLRSNEPVAPLSGAAPLPGVADIDRLLGDLSAAGFHVAVSRPTPLPDLAPATAATLFRVVQEGLTNARKHGTGSATLALHVRDGKLTVTITNPIDRLAPEASARAAEAESGGFGLTGLRERVAAQGGSLAAGSQVGVTGGADPVEYCLQVVLPITERQGS